MVPRWVSVVAGGERLTLSLVVPPNAGVAVVPRQSVRQALQVLVRLSSVWRLGVVLSDCVVRRDATELPLVTITV
jgi:hypothetical protein